MLFTVTGYFILPPKTAKVEDGFTLSFTKRQLLRVTRCRARLRETGMHFLHLLIGVTPIRYFRRSINLARFHNPLVNRGPS